MTYLTKNLIIKSGFKVMNYVKKIIFQSLINIMKLTKETIKLLVNLGTNMSNLIHVLLGKTDFNLTFII